ncbi:type IV toxin-antitoxin system AbiEi family antitoxin domain-containing protein [Brevibacterium paucivorans]|uniref:type IV toxin-antitoxin system AbiEi family antitoxin domain-containing protein n=1 Tax=Brevibacterium paucivorans TaxID=170994 RepID=UPI002155A604|nr:type IV toxin-antitoxin system AbiEi family antitoxin domain-containing protein [Brevibacterium paucivorans]
MALIDLTPVFTLEQARAAGLRKDEIYDLLAAEEIERVGRGVYLYPGMLDERFVSLASATAVRSEATMCLTSALAHHDLTDVIPFDTDTFTLGRETDRVAPGVTMAIYSPERTIVDCFRLMHHEGSETAHEALRRWLPRAGSMPARLLRMADAFPKAKPRLRLALDVLL